MKNVKRGVICLLCAALLSGCAASSAPEGFLPVAEDVAGSYAGAWLELSLKSGGRVYGEFLAADTASVFVLDKDKFSAVPVTNVSGARLFLWRAKTGSYAGYTVLGTLSTIGHGLFLIFTAPVWIIGGTVTTIGESYAPMDYQSEPTVAWWRGMAKYARFPQGIPQGTDTGQIKPHRELKK